MEQGYFTLVLHAHLPFVRHPEYESFLEEDWFFEALTETYIPLIRIFKTLESDHIPFKLTMSLTPPLLAMMADPLLQERYRRHLIRLIDLAQKEMERTRFQEELNTITRMYYQRFIEIQKIYIEDYQSRIIEAFKYFQDKGNLEIITCGATHGYLPLLNICPEAVKAQIQVAVSDYERYFGRKPKGIWVPECGYYEGLEKVLAEAGLIYFFTDAHTLIYGNPRPTFGNFAPVRTQSGIFAFARDIETSKMVWSREMGYPGDGYYREFYRDIGFELEYEYIRPYINSDGVRKNTGMKYYRITDRATHQKMVYEPEVALQKAEAHADHFVSGRVSHIRSLFKEMKKKPLIVSTYDAELFGHWWYEGPEWLNFLFRRAFAQDQNTFRMVTPSEYLASNPIHQTLQLTQSSWGDKGYHEFWLNPSNDWIYKHLHQAAFRMAEMANRFESPTPFQVRLLNQAARELLLAQSSDWAFIMRTGTMVEYAKKRFRNHIARFTKLYEDFIFGYTHETFLQEIEAKDNIFPELDYNVYRTKKE